MKSENNRAHLLTKFLDPDRHHKAAQTTPAECARDRARIGKFDSVGSGARFTVQGHSRQAGRSG